MKSLANFVNESKELLNRTNLFIDAIAPLMKGHSIEGFSDGSVAIDLRSNGSCLCIFDCAFKAYTVSAANTPNKSDAELYELARVNSLNQVNILVDAVKKLPYYSNKSSMNKRIMRDDKLRLAIREAEEEEKPYKSWNPIGKIPPGTKR